MASVVSIRMRSNLGLCDAAWIAILDREIHGAKDF